MSSKVFFYCLKVWLASVVLGPTLFWATSVPPINPNGSYTLADFLGFWAYGIVYGLAFSLISFLLFWAAMIYVSRRNWPSKQRRLVTVLLGIILTVAPFLILFQTVDLLGLTDRIAFCGSYLLPIVAGIFFYRWPRASKQEVKIDRA